jgi:hypothetical protein
MKSRYLESVEGSQINNRFILKKGYFFLHSKAYLILILNPMTQGTCRNSYRKGLQNKSLKLKIDPI